MSLGGDELLSQIENQNPRLGQYLRLLGRRVEHLGKNIGAAPTGFIPAPPKPQGLIVNQQGTENLQITVQHTSPVNKLVEYFTEVATNPAFSNPRVEHHGASRSPVSTLFLPTFNSSGTKHNYYIRTYAQYPGSPPSAPHVYSGNPITMTGTTTADHTPSTGSGTGKSDGSQGGAGWGKTLQRPVVRAKRVVSG